MLPVQTPFSGRFLTDQILGPLRTVTGNLRRQPPRNYIFYAQSGRIFGSDGFFHIPLNPAVLGYFSALFQASLEKKVRGSLTFILSEAETTRYAIVTDNHNLHFTLIKLTDAVSLAARNNAHPDVIYTKRNH